MTKRWVLELKGRRLRVCRGRVYLTGFIDDGRNGAKDVAYTHSPDPLDAKMMTRAAATMAMTRVAMIEPGVWMRVRKMPKVQSKTGSDTPFDPCPFCHQREGHKIDCSRPVRRI